MRSLPARTFTCQAVEHHLPTRRVGKTCMVYDRVVSTNDVVRSVMSDRTYDGLAVFANYQSGGRGRNGRIWQAPPNSSVLCSILLIFNGELSQLAGPVNLAAAVAVANAVNLCFPIQSKIKWPNDIFVGDKKLGGILIESSQLDRDAVAFVVGIGLNVLQSERDVPADLRNCACSVSMAVGRELEQSDRVALARQVLIELDRTVEWVATGRFDQLRVDWLALAADRDTMVTVQHEGRELRAEIIDIDYRDNSLLVRQDGGFIWHLKANVSRLVK